MKMITALIYFMAFAGCALDDAEALSEDSQAASEAPSAITGNLWLICELGSLNGVCQGGPVRIPSLTWPMDDNGSSIQTNGTAMETWNDPNFKGTYGYFAPWGTWNTLSAPYSDAISSISYPGV